MLHLETLIYILQNSLCFFCEYHTMVTKICFYVYAKIWNTSNYSMVGSLGTASEVRAMAMSSELLYLGCKGGAVEIWDRKKQSRIDTLQMGTNSKIACMTVDGNEEILVIGTSEGRIQVPL